MSLRFTPTGNLDVATDPSTLPGEIAEKSEASGAMRRCTNLHLDKAGVASTRRGSRKINASATAQTNPYLLMEQAGARYLFSGTSIYKDEVSHGTDYSDLEWSGIKYNAFNSLVENILALNGAQRKRIDSDEVNEWGLEPPTIDPRTMVGGQTGLTGNYNAQYTFARKEGNVVVCESNPSNAPSDAITLTDQSLRVICELPSDSQATHIRVYRTLASQEVYYHEQDVALLAEADYTYCFDWEYSNSHMAGVGYKFTTTVEALGETFTEMHDCDAVSDSNGTWSVESGAGVTLSLDTTQYKEGIGSIKVVIPRRTTAVIKFSKAGSPWDLSPHRYIGMWLMSSRSISGKTPFISHFGEAAYGEQSSSAFGLTGAGTTWEQKLWDISGITGTSRDAVTEFAIEIENDELIWSNTVWIDYVIPEISTSGFEKIYDWEAYGTGSVSFLYGLHDWEPIIIDSAEDDVDLGNEVPDDHNRPPLGSFVFGPSLNGTCFILKDNRLYYCLPKQPEYWPVLYYLEVSPIQFPLKAGCLLDGQVYAASSDEIYMIQGSGHLSWSPPLSMSAITGTISPKCFLGIHGKGIFHLGNDGLYLYSGSADQNVTNTKFRPIFQGTAVGSMPGAENLSNSWLIVFENKLYFGYPQVGSTYPDQIIVTDLDTEKSMHYSFGVQFPAVGIDFENDMLLAADTSGYVWEIEDKDSTGDDGTAISWDIESKEFTDSLRKYFPRYARYDVGLDDTTTATAYVKINGVSRQTHTLSSSRNIRKRLVTGCVGDRVSMRITGTGPVDIYSGELE